jgi:ABC-type bacteriocin/lantibiotic exporter with double-glycine peptidase domain
MEQIDKIVVISYFTIGALCLFYFYVTFLQKAIYNLLRLAVSSLFFVIAFTFFSAGGKVLTGYSSTFTQVTLAASWIIVIAGFAVVSAMIKMNKKQCKKTCNK